MKAFVIFNLNTDEKIERCRLAAKNLSSSFDLYACPLQAKCLCMDEVKEGREKMKCDLVVSIGGDGTLLKASRLAYEKGVPVLGINAGHKGALCALRHDDDLASLSMDAFKIEDRFGLSFNEKKNRFALNDVVFVSSVNAHSVRLEARIGDNEPLSFQGDGLIISSPTGSTGYSYSCGGPIVNPKSDVILLTPIAPISGITRSIVVPSSLPIAIKPIAKGHVGASICFDGKDVGRVKEEVVVTISPKPLRLVCGVNR